jgi:hypothetical protein
MMSSLSPRYSAGFGVIALALILFSAGCSNDTPIEPLGESVSAPVLEVAAAIYQDQQNGRTAPSGLVQVQFGTDSLDFWPYTGDSFNGSAIDPINVIFVGQASPLQIREALMSLDGDRSAFGIAPIPPFNSRWTDAVGGGVQTTYAEGGQGWSGSVIQLTLGEFGPLRFHLRLFSTAENFGGEGGWTLGGAHFEIQIPNTTEHQVLSWELAEQIVLVDMMRTGLLDSSVPMMPSGLINAAPEWRSIPAVIYNGLPDELIESFDGPPKPVTDDVPLPSDGQATVFHLVSALPISSGTWTHSAHVEFDQDVPMPFCAEGPGDFLHISGPVDFNTLVVIDEAGRYTTESDFTGNLTGAPIPYGELLTARVDGKEKGFMDAFGERITVRDKRVAFGADGYALSWSSFSIQASMQRTVRSGRPLNRSDPTRDWPAQSFSSSFSMFRECSLSGFSSRDRLQFRIAFSVSPHFMSASA